MLLSSAAIGSEPSCSRAATARRPFCQVHIAAKMMKASASGTQPPSTNFIMLADISVASTTMKPPSTRIDSGQLHFQAPTASANTRIVVTSIVPVTAMP